MRKFVVFPDQSTYDTWHNALMTARGYTVETSPYAGYFVNLVDPVAAPQVLVRIDSSIDTTGMTLWDEPTAINNGFFDPVTYIKDQIRKSKAFGEDLIARVGAENVAMGLSREVIGQMSTDMFQIQLAVQSGSLILARDLLAAFTPTAYMSVERRDALVAEIDAFLAEL